jgi:putative protease
MQAQKTAGIFKSLWTQAVQGRGIDPKKTEEAVKDLDGLYPEGFTKGHFYRGVLS